MKQTLSIGAFALMTCGAGVAFGQTAVPGVPPAPSVNVPPAPCEKPPTTAGLDPSAAQHKRWQKSIEDYKKCVVDYANSVGEQAKAYNVVANQLVEANKKIIDDFNTYAQQVRKDNDADDQ